MVIIGSTAIKHHFPHFNRQPKDIDYAVSSRDGLTSTREVEFLLNPVLNRWTSEKFCPPNLLLTLKMSHLFWDLNWDKHMFDVQFLLDEGATMDKKFFFEMLEYWKENNPKIKRSRLDMSKEEFFTNAVNYNEHEHDYLHTLINDSPMYTRILKDGQEVELDMSKWEELSHEDKLETIREEVYVMAWERFKKDSWVTAYRKMLRKFIRQHAPEDMAIYAILNYKDLLTPKVNYINIINDGLQKVECVSI